jgi:hypothetical protein
VPNKLLNVSKDILPLAGSSLIKSPFDQPLRKKKKKKKKK